MHAPFTLCREDLLARLRNQIEWDLIVIGGGATGLGTALDASTRGLRTLLLEAGDFAGGSSSRSTKLLHGGVRYLEHGDFRLVLQALHERGRVLRNAPSGLVGELGFVVPCYRWFDLLFYGAGLKLYDLMAGSRRLRASRLLGAAGVRQRIATVAPRDARGRRLKGGVLYYDGQFDDAGLAISLMRSVHAHGGVAINYVGVDAFLRDAGRIVGVQARDAETGERFALHASAVVNATGVWVDAVRQLDDPHCEPLLSPSQGSHIVLDREFLPGKDALLVPRTADGRVLFCIPWQGKVLVGTTDLARETVEREPRPQQEEIEFMLATAAQVLDRAPGVADIRARFAGLRPLVRAADGLSTAELSREHAIVRSASGLLSVTGGKWTTYRRIAQDVVDRLVDDGDLCAGPCITDYLALDDLVLGQRDGHRLLPDFSWTLEDVHVARQCMLARTAQDVLYRRMRIGMLDEAQAEALVSRIESLLGEMSPG